MVFFRPSCTISNFSTVWENSFKYCVSLFDSFLPALAASTCYSPTNMELLQSMSKHLTFLHHSPGTPLGLLDLTSNQAWHAPVFWWKLLQLWQPIFVQKLRSFVSILMKNPAPPCMLSPHNAGHNLPVHQIPPPVSTTVPCELPKEASGMHICAHPVWHKTIKGEKRCSLNIMPEFSIITISPCQN